MTNIIKRVVYHINNVFIEARDDAAGKEYGKNIKTICLPHPGYLTRKIDIDSITNIFIYVATFYFPPPETERA